jgi:hypothetical protein
VRRVDHNSTTVTTKRCPGIASTTHTVSLPRFQESPLQLAHAGRPRNLGHGTSMAISQAHRNCTLLYSISSDKLEKRYITRQIDLLVGHPCGFNSQIDTRCALPPRRGSHMGGLDRPSVSTPRASCMATPHIEFFSKPTRHTPSSTPILRPIFTPTQAVEARNLTP